MDRFGIIGELLQMVWNRKAWALLPVIVALVLLGALIVVGQATPLGPLVYPLF